MLSLPSAPFSLFLLLPLLLLHVPCCWAASEAQAVEPPPQIPDKTLAAAGVVTGTGTGGVVPPFRDGPEEGGGAEPPLPRGPLTRGGRPPLPSLVPVPADETTAKGNETKQPKPLPEFRRWPLLGDLDCGR
jgi:hypothetical protein